jgi:pyruvate/2-oxoglutarate dehydrogenase complex dihydrolipoamide dehydrogenase (E3) component
MATYEYDIGIIGGGAAGLTVASGSAKLGAKTLLVEKEKELGGDCLHFGCVPSKTLIKTAHIYHLMKNLEIFGLPGIKVPPVDFPKITQRIKSVIGLIQKHDSEERFCGLGAKVVFGNPVFIDPKTIDLDGNIYSAQKWVIATGSSPSVLPLPGLRETPHITNKEIFYLDKLPETLIIIGAGPIGIEMAQAFQRLGSKVFVIDKAEQILRKEDADMADAVMEVLKSEGVVFHLGSTILEVKDLGNIKEILLSDKIGKTARIKGHTILVAMGRVPNTSGLGLEEIGVELENCAVKVDNRMRSNLKHIFAAGDVIGRYQFTHAAGYEGGIVLSNAIFHMPKKVDYANFPWCTYTKPELAGIGMNEKAAKKAGIKYSIWTEAFKDNDRSLAEGEQKGMLKMLLNEKEKPVGIQIFGPHAGDLINEWVAVMAGNIKMSVLASAVHPYPTVGEINKRVAGSYLSTKIFSDTVKKGLKFFFNLKGRACSVDYFS